MVWYIFLQNCSEWCRIWRNKERDRDFSFTCGSNPHGVKMLYPLTWMLKQ